DVRRGLKRVAAQVHRRGASVVGAAFDGHLEAVQAGNRVDDSEWQALNEQDAALLDVQLDERVQVIPPGLAEALGRETNLGHRLAYARAAFIAERVELTFVDEAEDAAGAPEVAVEAAVFLLAQCHDLERTQRRAQPLLQQAHGGQRAEYAQGAVVAATEAHRVNV